MISTLLHSNGQVQILQTEDVLTVLSQCCYSTPVWERETSSGRTYPYCQVCDTSLWSGSGLELFCSLGLSVDPSTLAYWVEKWCEYPEGTVTVEVT